MKYTTDQIIDFVANPKRFYKKKFKVEKIGIYGSYARVDADEGTDIDIVVELGKPDLFYMYYRWLL